MRHNSPHCHGRLLPDGSGAHPARYKCEKCWAFCTVSGDPYPHETDERVPDGDDWWDNAPADVLRADRTGKRR